MHSLMPRWRCGAVGLTLLFVALVAGCAGVGRSDTAQLADFMRQERGWAGLSTHVATLPDNTPVTYSEGGPAAAPTLVLLHGYTGDRNHWNRVARELTPRWHLIVPDLPGHGETPLDDNASADGMSNTLIDFARALGLDDYTLVGHSMGGAVAELWALGQPDKTRGLVPATEQIFKLDTPRRARVLIEGMGARLLSPEEVRGRLNLTKRNPIG